MNCFLTKNNCIIKPSGFEATCFSTCPDAIGFLEEYNLTHTDKEGVIWYLEDTLDNTKNEEDKIVLRKL